jgi:phosphoglycolate phosphatase
MVGDTTFDIAMGVAAGAEAIGVAWGYHPPEALYGAGAAIVVPSAGALEACLFESVAPRF